MKRFLLYSSCFLVCFAYLIISAEEKGVQENNPFYPFVDNGDGTITDTVTGLIWTKKAYRVTDEAYDETARQKSLDPIFPSKILRGCKVEGVEGPYSDWYLPTLLELRGLYQSLGMITGYKATDDKERPYWPFEWPEKTLISITAQRTNRDEVVDYNEYGWIIRGFDFATGEEVSFAANLSRYRIDNIWLGEEPQRIYVRFVRSVDGTGYELVTCPKCEGKGSVSVERERRIQGELTKIRCSHCGGSGRHSGSWDGYCPYCVGRGYNYGETYSTKIETYTKQIPCDKCEGVGDILRYTKKKGTQPAITSNTIIRQESSKNEEFGKIIVTSEPENCDIYVDGIFVGNTPATIKLKSGTYTIGVKKDGYKLYEKEIHIFGGSELTLRAVLMQE